MEREKAMYQMKIFRLLAVEHVAVLKVVMDVTMKVYSGRTGMLLFESYIQNTED